MMMTFIGWWLCVAIAAVNGASSFAAPDLFEELATLLLDDFTHYAALHGMELTTHEVVTRDNWLLQLWRIKSPDIFNRTHSTPVLLSHGFGASVFDYMTNLRNQSLPYILADNGYDVWMVNYRANQFSNYKLLNGKRVTPSGTDYYRASWQLMAEIDLPTAIDAVLNETNEKKLYLIGHSMGGTIPFAALSENHAYDDKIIHFSAVVPVLKFGEDTSIRLKVLLETLPQTMRYLPKLVFKILFGRQLLASTGSDLKSLKSFLMTSECLLNPTLCNLLYAFVFNRDWSDAIHGDPHLNQTRSSVMVSRSPGGIAFINLFNYGMQWGRDPWTKIDYRLIPQSGLTNKKEYNTTTPPSYNFAAVKVNYSLFFVKNDIFFGLDTVQKVIDELNATDYKIIEGNKLTHVSAVVGWDVRCYVIDDILAKFDKLERSREPSRAVYRDQVGVFLKTLSMEDGCVGKSI